MIASLLLLNFDKHCQLQADIEKIQQNRKHANVGDFALVI